MDCSGLAQSLRLHWQEKSAHDTDGVVDGREGEMKDVAFDGEGGGWITVQILVRDDEEEPLFDGFNLAGWECVGAGEMGPFLR